MIEVGDIFTSNNCGDLVITKYVNARRVYYKFIVTGFKGCTQSGNIRRGTVKDLMHPTVSGVGFLGGTEYLKIENPGAYDSWASMLKRCYSENCLTRCPTYRGCSVTPDWHNFQVYAVWYYEHYVEGYHLDKDIKVKGNRVYGPGTCMFVTPTENSVERNLTGLLYTVYHPEHGEHRLTNIREFSKEHDITESLLGRVLLGRRKQHKGWKLVSKKEIAE